MKIYRKSRNSMFLFKPCATKLVAIIVMVTMGMVTDAQAGMLTFTHEGYGSGTLAGNPFPESHFVITTVGDTDERVSILLGYGWSIDHSWAAISIDGIGDFMFLTATRTFVNNNTQTVGFSRAGSYRADLFDGPSNAQFASWDMLNPIGPISGTGWLMQWDGSWPQINTTGGILIFYDNTCNATFTAIPEPSTLLLLGLGALFLRRKTIKM